MTSIASKLKVGFDKPIWEWCRQAPAVSTGISTTCVADNNKFRSDNQRYIYYYISATQFWKYDTWTDTWIQLASLTHTTQLPNTYFNSMKYADTAGYRNRVISATSTTITSGIPGTQVLGYEIRITGGTGKGQRRMITAVSNPTVAASGVATSAATTNITDTLKSWTINQWVGYVLRIGHTMSSAGPISNIRKIIYNGTTFAVHQEPTHYAYNDQCMPAPITPVANQTRYTIESSVMTVDTAWDVTPDATSEFTICSGGIYMYAGTFTTLPYHTVYYYDLLTDIWYQKPTAGSWLGRGSSVNQEGKLCRLGENACLWEYGKATSGSATTLVDTTKEWTTNQWVGYNVRIWTGAGKNTIRAISGNTATTLTIASGTALDSTSRYCIEGFDSGIASSGSTTTLVDSTKSWATDRWKNYCLEIVGGTGVGQSCPILSNTSTTITLLKTQAVALDSTSIYIIRGDSDRMYVSGVVGSWNGHAQLGLWDTESDMTLTSRALDFGVARGGSAQYGQFPPISIASGTVAANVVTITTSQFHNFVTGMSITHRGDTGASAGFNNITATITVTSTTTYTYPAPSSVNNWVITAPSTTTLVDASKNWTTNQWAGHILTFTVTQGPTPTVASITIASNTSNTLTLNVTNTASVVGVTKYAIHPVTTTIGASETGLSTAGSLDVITDTTKNWVVNSLVGLRVRALSNGQSGVEGWIISNTATSLTSNSMNTTTGTHYAIYTTNVRSLGHSLDWLYGQSDLSKRGRYILSSRGNGATGWDMYDICTNTWTGCQFTPVSDAPTTGTMYSYDGGDRLYYNLHSTLRVNYIDLLTNQIYGAGTYPYLTGSTNASNRMEIITNADGSEFLWVNRNGQAECYMQLLFY